MAKSLVIVESPAKAKTINRILGRNYKVCSSMGHVIDLPKGKMGVDIENKFKPEYCVMYGRKKILTSLRKELKDKENLYLAPDPDREGEAISWHLADYLGKGKKVYRVSFNEITERAIIEAFKHPRKINMNLVNAQQARRILDRIVGYSISPLLWRKVGKGLSAGRVQSIALKLIVDKEKEINAFIPKEYWEIDAILNKSGSEKFFTAKISKKDNKKLEIKNKQESDTILEELKKGSFIVSNIIQKDKKRNPHPPFTTSKLQQEAFNKIRFSANKTMRIAQSLYEGIDIGDKGSVGLITYMRTDSVQISKDALIRLREFIKKVYGKESLPDKPNLYKSKKSAQEAHEAIRPTSPERTPESIKEYLNPDQLKLYTLIWNKFVASQMKSAIFKATTIEIKNGKYLFKATGSIIKFKGFLVLYPDSEEALKELPKLKVNDDLDCKEIIPSQHFTKPPGRYTDASLVKSLEEKGIGRPSTYAPTISTIIYRGYVYREGSSLAPTEIGTVVTELLEKHFTQIIDENFTSYMEEQLDEIENGKADWVATLDTFYSPFSEVLKQAQANMKNLKKEIVYTNEKCEQCGKRMVLRWGRAGKFLGCEGFPECKNTKSSEAGPDCPEEGCNGQLIKRRSKKGRPFYGCSNYPKCTFLSNKLPVRKENTEGGIED